jgi:hypothetical protein
MAVIAAQLGNQENICAKHYAHLSPGYVAETVRQAFGRLEAPVETDVRQSGKPAIDPTPASPLFAPLARLG